MPWYHWIGMYMVIIGGITFTIFPEKTWHMWLIILVGILGGLAIVALTPARAHIHLKGYVDKYNDKEGE